jgi:hypothetical protein
MSTRLCQWPSSRNMTDGWLSSAHPFKAKPFPASHILWSPSLRWLDTKCVNYIRRWRCSRRSNWQSCEVRWGLSFIREGPGEMTSRLFLAPLSESVLVWTLFRIRTLIVVVIRPVISC